MTQNPRPQAPPHALEADEIEGTEAELEAAWAAYLEVTGRGEGMGKIIRLPLP